MMNIQLNITLDNDILIRLLELYLAQTEKPSKNRFRFYVKRQVKMFGIDEYSLFQGEKYIHRDQNVKKMASNLIDEWFC